MKIVNIATSACLTPSAPDRSVRSGVTKKIIFIPRSPSIRKKPSTSVGGFFFCSDFARNLPEDKSKNLQTLTESLFQWWR